MSRSLSECIRIASERFSAVSDSARLDAEVLLAWVLGKDRAYLFTWPEKILDGEEQERFEAYVARRAQGEPVAYILGEKEFWSLPLYSEPSTLIPRPDTEVLVEQVLAQLPEQPQKILDLGTGTGAIALALASERKDCDVHAVDKMASAVQLANKNVKRLNIQNVRIFQSDWFGAITEKYNVIVSNPPYIDVNDKHLKQGDVKYEPKTALVAAENGLADIRYIADNAKAFLILGGMLVFEHGYDQREAVQLIMAQAGYAGVTTEKDYHGQDRVTLGYFK
ncbi:MAG: peptide chain release factor N(5)-glutamine methyltransferase [Agarilytica sp.]